MSRKEKTQAATVKHQRSILGDELSFAASEAYKLLRTNLTLTLPNGRGCQIIGLTSSVAGEGKSTTSVNLAYVLAESGKRVLLLEGDMRRPTVAQRLGLEATPGLSNLLVGLCSGDEALQRSNLHHNLYLITAGDVPPNPSELLSSDRMGLTLAALANNFDYIILDLPPVTSVADALIMTKLVDGIIVVVRRGYCRRALLQNTLRQLELLDAKVLGFVMTHENVHSKEYKQYGKYYGYSRKATRQQKRSRERK